MAQSYRAPEAAGCCREGHHLLAPEETLDFALIGALDVLISTKTTLALGRLLPEVVALHRLPAQELPRSGHLEPLLRSAVSLLLWHLLRLLRSSSGRAP